MEKIKEIFLRNSYDDIAPAFAALWEANRPGQMARQDPALWRAVYDRLRTIEPATSRCCARLACRWEGCSPLVDMNCSVYFTETGELCMPVALYTPWSEVLGMELALDDDVVLSDAELAAGLLWELTYYGPTEEAVSEMAASLS